LADVLTTELGTYLLAHARENNYQLPTHPAVSFITDPELHLGKFDVIGETLSQAEIDKELGIEPAPEPAIPAHGAAPVVAPAVPIASVAPPAAVAPTSDEPAPAYAKLVSPLLGSIALDQKDTYTIGRKETCDIRLDDSAASRVHATLTHDGRTWTITDNDSTNATQINGHPVTSRLLRSGDVITIGTTQFTFRNEGPPPPKFEPSAEEIGIESGGRDLIRDLL